MSGKRKMPENSENFPSFPLAHSRDRKTESPENTPLGVSGFSVPFRSAGLMYGKDISGKKEAPQNAIAANFFLPGRQFF